MQKQHTNGVKVVTCFHSNRQKHGINKQRHQFHREINTQCLILHGMCNKALCARTESCKGRTNEKVCYSHTCPNTDFLSGWTATCWAVLSRKFTPVLFLDCFAVLAITQLYQHILEAWRTCSEAWGCLFGDRNIMTFWLEAVHLSWRVNTSHKLSYLMNLYYIWSFRFKSGRYMLIQHVHPFEAHLGLLVASAGPLHLSCKTDIQAGCEGVVAVVVVGVFTRISLPKL